MKARNTIRNALNPCIAALIGYIGLTAVAWVSTAMHDQPLDDAFMALRYARNLLSTGTIAWNPEDGAVWGQTSLLYFLLVITPLHVLSWGETLHIPKIASNLSFLLLTAMAALLLLKNRSLRDSAAAPELYWRFGLLAALSAAIAKYASNGMDTTFATLGAFVLAFTSLSAAKTGRFSIALLTQVLAAVSYWIRPDLLLLSFPILVAHILLTHDWKRRVLLATTFSVVLGLIAASSWYLFEDVVPTSFYAKVGGIYGSTYTRQFRLGWNHLAFAAASPAIISSLLVLLLFWRDWQQTPLAPWKVQAYTIVGAALCFWGFQYHGVLHVMGYQGRFYAPSIGAFMAILAFVPSACNPLPATARRTRGILTFSLACVVALTGRPNPFLTESTVTAAWPTRAEYEILYWRFIPCSEALRHASGTTIASGEVGYLGAITDAYIFDHVALNSRFRIDAKEEYAELINTSHFDVVSLPDISQPELYKLWLAELPLGDYDFWWRHQLGSLVDIAVRRDGKAPEIFRKCLNNKVASET